MIAGPINLKGLAIFFFFTNTRTQRGLASDHRALGVKASDWVFLALQEMWSEVEEMSCFSDKSVQTLQTGEYYHVLNDNGALWVGGALECRLIGLNIFALPCYLLEERRREGTNSVRVLGCVTALAEGGKVPSTLGKCLVFPCVVVLNVNNFNPHNAMITVIAQTLNR